MIEHSKKFYLILSGIVLLVCILIGLFAEDPVFYIITVLLLSINILLLFHLYLFKKRFEQFEISSESALEKVRIETEAECLKKTDELRMLYQQSRYNEIELRETIESAMQGVAVLSVNGNFEKVNVALCDIIGYSQEDMLKTDLQCITHHDDFILDRNNMNMLLTGSIPSFKLEKRLLHTAGITIWVMQYMKLIRAADGTPVHFVAHYIDITERKQAEEQLKKYTETLTVLLREVNHRVKNNLAALISMLHMEQNKASITKNTGYIDFLNDLISRIQSLSTVHSMLSAQNWQPLELSQLCSQVIQAATSGTPPGKKVLVQITPSKIKVNSNQAHHLTLVINELTTNSVKHAIHSRDQAIINVDISTEGEFILIRFKDDGPGFPQSLIDGDFSRANIGFELIRGIVLQSLDGEFCLENHNGATAIIKFQNELDIN